MAIRRPTFLRRRPPLPVCVALLLLGLVAVRLLRPSTRPVGSVFDSPGPFHVQRVIDGDTLLLDGGHRVRLIGVNTPETKHPDKPPEPLGPEAAEFTRKHVEGRLVGLQFDRERYDRFHRILAYVYLDDWLLNEELIRAGYSKAQTRFPYSTVMKRRFQKAEDEARSARRGLWAEDVSPATNQSRRDVRR